MRLKISHRTEYRYDAPVNYALQRLRLMPRGGKTQSVLSWSLSITGAQARKCASSTISRTRRGWSASRATRRRSRVEAGGEIETYNTAGVFGEHRGFAPLWLFEHADAADRRRRRHRRARPVDRPRLGTRQAAPADEHDRRARRLYARRDPCRHHGRRGAAAGQRRLPGPCACLCGGGAPARLSGALCQRLSDDERHDRPGREPRLGGGPCAGARLGRLRRFERHFARRALCPGRDRPRLSRRHAGVGNTTRTGRRNSLQSRSRWSSNPASFAADAIP